MLQSHAFFINNNFTFETGVENKYTCFSMNLKKRTVIIFIAPFLIICSVWLLKVCNGNRNGRSGVDRGHPPPTSAIVVTEESIKPSINVYVDYSGSMYGFVNGQATEFKDLIYKYLSDIQNLDIADSLTLFYINNRIIRHVANIQSFIQTLNPNTLNKIGGNQSTTHISNMIESILSETHKDNISVFITDGIYSPGALNASPLLIGLKTDITNSVTKFLRENTNAAILIYLLSAQFNGSFFNKMNAPIRINQQIPFYIWVIGDAKKLSALRTKFPEERFQGSGVQNMFSITTENKAVNYAIKPFSGNFKLHRKYPKTIITNWKKNSKGSNKNIAQFSINADLSGFLLDDDYLLNEQNYELNDKDFSLSVQILPQRKPQELPGNTHSLNISSAIVKKTSFSIKLKSQIPEWVEEVNDNDGSTAVAGKTYGIKYQIQGVYEAFTYNNDCYTEIKIDIK
jgi:hypothetical protein